MVRTRDWALFFLLAVILPGRLQSQTCVGDLCPLVAWDPAGDQRTQVTLYVPPRDEYFLVTNAWDGSSGGLVGRFVSPSGTLGPVSLILPGNNVQLAAMAYNPDRDEILLVMQDVSPRNLRGLFLDGDGIPLGSPFFVDSGEKPQVAYSPDSQRYVVTWARRGSQWVAYYGVIDGDSTSSSPVLNVGVIDSMGVNGPAECSGLTYGRSSGRFLVAYEKNYDVYGRFFSADGVPGAIFPVGDGGGGGVRRPCTSYARSSGQFIVSYVGPKPGSLGISDLNGALVSPSGIVVRRFVAFSSTNVLMTGPVAYDAISNAFVLSWNESKLGNQWSTRGFSAVDTAPVTPQLKVEFGNLSGGWLTSIATRPDALDPQAFFFWRSGVIPGLLGGFLHLPRPVTTLIGIDRPVGGAVGPSFAVSGWAADPVAPTGTGVDSVHVWAFPNTGGAIFLGSDYGRSRPDVGAYLGNSRFDDSGYRVDVAGLSPGGYRIRVYARSTLSGLFDQSKDVLVFVGLDPRIRVEAPVSGATVIAPITVRGWAADATAVSGTGVDAVQVWARPAGSSTSVFLGDATYGGSRPDIAALLGNPRFEPSGFELRVASLLAEGAYTLEVKARSTITGNYDILQLVPIQVDVIDILAVDRPVNGGGVGGPFVVSGWALNTGATVGTGIDAVHVWAISHKTGGAIFLGEATLGGSRPDVAAYFGLPQFEPSGYTLTTGPLPPGSYTLRVYARNTSSGTFETSRDVNVSTLGSLPVAAVDSPGPGAVSLPFEVSGWSVDLNASTGTGVDMVHVWVTPHSGGSPVFLGQASLGVERLDVATYFGRTSFKDAGFELEVSSLAPGTYTLIVWSRSTVSGKFTNAPPVVVSVP